MYANALILVAIGALQTSWVRVRIVMVVITLFSVFATILTSVSLTNRRRCKSSSTHRKIWHTRRLLWVGSIEWGIAAIATALLIFAPVAATVPLLVSFALYAPWAWLSARWILCGN